MRMFNTRQYLAIKQNNIKLFKMKYDKIDEIKKNIYIFNKIKSNKNFTSIEYIANNLYRIIKRQTSL